MEIEQENGHHHHHHHDAEIENEKEGINGCLSSFIDDGSIESHRYYLSRRTALEMLKDRGYSVPSSEIDISLSQFRAIHGQSPDIHRLRFSATHNSDPSKRILVIYCGPGVVKVNVIRNIAGQIVNRETLTGLILIVQDQITAQALKAVKIFSFKVEIFQLPRMLQTDAISKYYGLERGQVVKVTYSGEITEMHVTYRCVW
ncbi:PREDICTED: DNA-directed RNA polymerase V subunit 5A-like isoform X2 [Lupinus angustifolius]|uniref:DNA-directed RNA polymerase V subunit 5A-like isoform X2 n=1 Tax=Lupinus angustifolius TaxID=3871 RepID=UPI00092EDA4D|nr:PREDICTED: DNA-directed RNA polymerase V subunit 5A-like isoform X2 [Lupinus angustifolius]